jgi:hypothetical protein
MFAHARRFVATTLVSGTLVLGLAPAASAQVIQDGLVNVNISDNTVTVPVAVAAQLAVNACGIDVGPVAIGVLARATAVDRSGRTQTICRTDQGPVTISQNTEN